MNSVWYSDAELLCGTQSLDLHSSVGLFISPHCLYRCVLCLQYQSWRNRPEDSNTLRPHPPTPPS